jgi:hypothetical protein
MVLAALVVGVALIALPSERPVAQADTRIVVSPNGDRISINSSGTTRAQLLELLRSKYHIEVRPYLEPDQRVTIRVNNAPIDSAIALIMPRGSHYAVRLGERDIATAASLNTSVKKGPRDRRPPGLTPKTKSRIIPPVGPRFKPDPKQVEQPAPHGRTLKPADVNRTVPPGVGPKVARAVRGSPDSTLRLTFIIRAPDSIRVTDARLIDGVTPTSTIVRGPFVFVLRSAAGAVLYYGTLIDPLEEHAYENPTPGQHAASRAREGTFGISLPAAMLRRLTGARLEFYDASAASLPANLDARTLERILARSKRAGRVDGREVLTALRRSSSR